MDSDRRYSTRQVADKVGVSKETILRWLRAGKIPEPDRDRNGWRIFSDKEIKEILRFKNQVTPAEQNVR
jgi:site-specific DNA-methyltransferase (cytosine-N4-specific)